MLGKGTGAVDSALRGAAVAAMSGHLCGGNTCSKENLSRAHRYKETLLKICIKIFSKI